MIWLEVCRPHALKKCTGSTPLGNVDIDDVTAGIWKSAQLWLCWPGIPAGVVLGVLGAVVVAVAPEQPLGQSRSRSRAATGLFAAVRSRLPRIPQ